MQLSPQKAPPGGAGTASNAPASGSKVSTLAELIDAYLAVYTGRDSSRPRTLAFWRVQLGPARLFQEITDEDVFAGLERLKSEPHAVTPAATLTARPSTAVSIGASPRRLTATTRR